VRRVRRDHGSRPVFEDLAGQVLAGAPGNIAAVCSVLKAAWRRTSKPRLRIENHRVLLEMVFYIVSIIGHFASRTGFVLILYLLCGLPGTPVIIFHFLFIFYVSQCSNDEYLFLYGFYGFNKNKKKCPSAETMIHLAGKKATRISTKLCMV
jgi:hypothetical protein